MRRLIAGFLKEEGGATAIEYGLIAMLICVVIITALVSVGSQLTSVFNTIQNKVMSSQ